MNLSNIPITIYGSKEAISVRESFFGAVFLAIKSYHEVIVASNLLANKEVLGSSMNYKTLV